jgi:hypothetical protein
MVFSRTVSPPKSFFPVAASAAARFAAADRCCGWTHEQLMRMDDCFVVAVERAIAAGDESPPGIAGLASAR